MAENVTLEALVGTLEVIIDNCRIMESIQLRMLNFLVSDAESLLDFLVRIRSSLP